MQASALRPLRGGIDEAIRAWDRFFFTPVDPLPVGLIRIGTGLLLIWSHVVTALDLSGFLGSNGWADPAIVRQMWGPDSRNWSLWFLVPDEGLWPAWLAGLAVLVLFTAGIWPRMTAVLAWALAVSTSRRVPVMLHGFDQVLALWVFYLAVTGASGQALALRFPARAPGRVAGQRGSRNPATISANLCLRLIQIHLCVIYLIAGLAKLQGPSWWDGTAVGMLLGNSEFRPIDLTWLARYPYLINLATHGTIAFELAYPVLIWNRWWRPVLLSIAIALHAAIAVVMGLSEFALTMALGNMAFLSGGAYRAAGMWLAARMGRIRVEFKR
jgi:hypothetical protein